MAGHIADLQTVDVSRIICSAYNNFTNRWNRPPRALNLV